jgi:hypothetical protein
MSTFRVWCLLVDYKKQPNGKVFSVRMSYEDCIDDLKKEVKKQTAPQLDDIASNHLIVWKCPGLTFVEDSEGNALEPGVDISRVDFTNSQSAFILGESRNVAALNLTEADTLLAEMPGVFSLILTNRNSDVGPEGTIRHEEATALQDDMELFVRNYKDIFVKVHDCGTNNFTYDDLGLNHMLSCSNVPNFVEVFEEKLAHKPVLTERVHLFFISQSTSYL